MRSPVVNFRADPELLSALREKASAGGETLSEVMRRALRAQIYGQGEGMGEGRTRNPFARLQPAATGCIEAQRNFVTDAIRAAGDEGDLAAAIEGLVFARLAAAQGGEADIASLFALLALTGDLLEGDEQWSEYRDSLNAEAIALVNQLADRGVELAEQMLPQLVDTSSPRAIEMAHAIRNLISA